MPQSPQKKSGTQFIPGSGSSDKGTPMKDPLAGNSGTSTHTDFSKGSTKTSKGGKPIDGQNLRGYVFNQPGRSIGAVDDATVAPDGTRRVRKSD